VKIWTFLLDRAIAAREGFYGPRDPYLADSIMAVLDVHNVRSEEDLSCRGCGFTADGAPSAPTVDDCPTLRALAWMCHNHPDWRRHWLLDAKDFLETWPPELNCFCGGARRAHRRGTARHCRPSRATRRWEQRAGVA
jgi:hypothetical protein